MAVDRRKCSEGQKGGWALLINKSLLLLATCFLVTASLKILRGARKDLGGANTPMMASLTGIQPTNIIITYKAIFTKVIY